MIGLYSMILLLSKASFRSKMLGFVLVDPHCNFGKSILMICQRLSSRKCGLRNSRPF
ncbi:hypothetical protein D1BOALGB6SA_7025 [Olavius sp. associated proteobacterium Delta 1]|nr:hypothetical protein D1BOALGB6SA_7025 [Olavius sp. associated proteobacterium Delta 1]